MRGLRRHRGLHIIRVKDIIAPFWAEHFEGKPEQDQIDMAKNAILHVFPNYYHGKETWATNDAKQAVRELAVWLKKPDPVHPFTGLDVPAPAQRTLDVPFIDESVIEE